MNDTIIFFITLAIIIFLLWVFKAPSHHMKYFTPELYEFFNSKYSFNADWAEEEWDKNLKKYADYLKLIPEKLKELAYSYFHDAEFIYDKEEAGIYIIVLKLKDSKNISIIYNLRSKVQIFPIPSHFSGRYWKYDEVEFLGKNKYLHKIFMDGKVIEVPFKDYKIIKTGS